MGKMLDILRANEAKERKEWGFMMPKTLSDEESVFDLRTTVKQQQKIIHSLRTELYKMKQELNKYTQAASIKHVKEKPPVEYNTISGLVDAEDLICKTFGITKEQLFRVGKMDSNVMFAKHVGRYVCMAGFKMTTIATAERYNKKNHTTCIHSKKYINNMYRNGVMPTTVMHIINACCGRQIFTPYDSNM